MHHEPANSHGWGREAECAGGWKLELRLQLYRKIYSDEGRIETRCGILVRVLGVGFSSCAVPTFSDSPSISNTTWVKIPKVGIGSYEVGIQMLEVSLRDKSVEVKIEARV